ncbi:putative aspartokinase [uncultured archaeon]|nr:putative aspartokinase [uncultured archaeon]
MSLIVSKYGGSSSTCTEDVKRKKFIAEADPRRKIIVLSAHGKLAGEDKDTDLLIKLSRNSDPSLKQKLLDKARFIYTELPRAAFNEVEQELERRLQTTGESREDAIKSWGEYACAKLTANALGFEFIDPRELFVLTPEFGNAKILESSRGLIRKRLETIKGVCVIPGFYGYTEDGLIATLSRGGSDLTGAYVAAALGAEIYENFTDSPVLTTDPKLISKNPAVIKQITYKELRDLSYSGFGIFHPEAVLPVKKEGIPIHVRSTTKFPEEGTYVMQNRLCRTDRPVVGIAFKGGYCAIDIQKDGLNEQRGVGRKLLEILDRNKLSYELMPGAIDDISIILQQNQMGDQLLNRVMGEMYGAVGDNDAEVKHRENLGILVVAGKGISQSGNIESRIHGALERAHVNDQFGSKGSTKRCIICGIYETDGPRAVQALFEEFPYLFAA